jgi:putative transposase
VGYKFRFYPAKEQEGMLSHTFSCIRFVYNYFLFLRQESYIKEGKKINYHDTSKGLTELKSAKDKEWPN